MTRGSRSAPVTGVLLGLLVVLLPAVVPAPASAATTVGSTPTPNTNCNSVFTFVPSPATGYTVAAPGIVTAWRFQAAGNAPQLKLKVFRPVGPTTYTIIGATGPVAPVLNVLNTFAARIAVQAGDVVGFTTLSTGACFATPGGGFVAASGDVAVGGTQTFASSLAGTLDVAAVVEPDADGDGYGDETQDACPSQSGTQGACAARPTRPLRRAGSRPGPRARPGRRRPSASPPTTRARASSAGSPVGRSAPSSSGPSGPAPHRRPTSGSDPVATWWRCGRSTRSATSRPRRPPRDSGS